MTPLLPKTNYFHLFSVSLTLDAFLSARLETLRIPSERRHAQKRHGAQQCTLLPWRGWLTKKRRSSRSVVFFFKWEAGTACKNLQICIMCKKHLAEISRKLLIFETDFLLKCWIWSGAKVCNSCRAWEMLSNAYLLATFRFDTAENEPVENFTCKSLQKIANTQ